MFSSERSLKPPLQSDDYFAAFDIIQNLKTTKGIDFLLNIGRCLRSLDKEEKNVVHEEDFITLMMEMNLLTRKEAKEVFMDADINDNGFLPLDDFMKYLRGFISPMRKMAIELAVSAADVNYDGLIPIDYFEKNWDGTLQTYLGEDKTAHERKVVLIDTLKKDSQFEGYVTVEDLTNLLWVQSLMTEDDVDFVLTVRQAYRLDWPAKDKE